MANAKLDQNGKQTITGLLSTNGTTITKIQADPTTHAISVADAATGSDHGGTKAATDDNGRPTLFAVSSADGVTPVALYVDSTGHLLVKST